MYPEYMSKDKNIYENDDPHHGIGDIDINIDSENKVDKYEGRDIKTYENGNLENNYSGREMNVNTNDKEKDFNEFGGKDKTIDNDDNLGHGMEDIATNGDNADA